jgi:CRISPR-associated protein Cas2
MSDEKRVRFMRLVVFFDLPVETAKQRKEYRLFRKFLIKDGYLAMQESVYSRLVTTDAAASRALERMKKHRPPDGIVQVLRVSERQYETMVFITGNKPESDTIDSMDEFVVI